MSNYIKPKYCPTCRKVTNHEFADDTPRRHIYTKFCEVCNHSTVLEPEDGVDPIDPTEDPALALLIGMSTVAHLASRGTVE